jgi:hypothetical protein
VAVGEQTHVAGGGHLPMAAHITVETGETGTLRHTFAAGEAVIGCHQPGPDAAASPTAYDDSIRAAARRATVPRVAAVGPPIGAAGHRGATTEI